MKGDTLVEECQSQSKRLVKSLIWWSLFRFRQGLLQSYTHFLIDSRQIGIDNNSKQWKEVYYNSVPVHLPVLCIKLSIPARSAIWCIDVDTINHNNGRTQCINKSPYVTHTIIIGNITNDKKCLDWIN
jgi:hypothetical protein